MAKYINLEKLMKFPIRRNHYDKEHGNEDFICGIETVLEYAENLPVADVAPVRHGRWKCHGDCGVTECSACGWSIEEYVGDYAYCPNCGAKMDGGERMTYEEVLNRLKICVDECDDCLTCKAMEDSIEIAIEALEKQIPKKPLHMHKNYYCPICKEDGWMLWDDAIPNDMDKYCGMCGQAIDWEVSE